MANLESRIPGPPVGYCSSSEDEGDSPALNVVKDDDAHQAKAMNGFLNTGIAEMAKRGMLSGRKEEEHNDSDLELDDDVVREADLSTTPSMKEYGTESITGMQTTDLEENHFIYGS
ncbi:hypothetical protein QR680_002082 [Steinernema hermaphroditum]|uniref:Uncharacterized protein n=1 Tax=Steinernema hermaphroditum TaxID=289476 RepID=A0AA39H3Y1_9BILA|nr:hypothetical protein QR680_002082 [Steinernema hermaphroditum]